MNRLIRLASQKTRSGLIFPQRAKSGKSDQENGKEKPKKDGDGKKEETGPCGHKIQPTAPKCKEGGFPSGGGGGDKDGGKDGGDGKDKKNGGKGKGKKDGDKKCD